MIEQRFLPTSTVTSYVYDDGNRLVSRFVNGIGPTQTFDEVGRPTRIDYSDGTFETFEYDAGGNVVTFLSRDNLKWRYEYNDLGDVEKTIDPGGNVSTVAFDSSGYAESITDALGRRTEVAYNNLGDLALKRLPLGQAETFVYNDAGVPVSRISFGGTELFMEYDDQQRLTAVLDADSQVVESRTYSNDGSYAVTNGFGTTSVSVNALGNVSEWTSVNGTTVESLYDAAGTLAGIETSLGKTDVEFTSLGVLSKITAPDSSVISISYDANGLPVEVLYADGSKRVQVNDAEARVQKISFFDSGDILIFEQTFTRDATGRVSSITELTGRVSEFTYDALGRLLSERIIAPNGTSSDVVYAYDAVGNILSTTQTAGTVSRSYDVNDRIISDGTWTYEFDDDGNLTRRTSAVATEEYFYDEFQRLVRFIRIGNTPVVIEYAYDSDGLIASRTVDGTSTHYVWDRSSPLQPFVYEVVGQDGSLIRRYHNDGENYISVEDSAGNRSVLFTDNLGSISGIAKATGVTEISYDAFGNLLNNNPLDVGFAGGFFDSLTGLTYFVSRWYDSANGRFTQTDSAAALVNDSRTLNRYVYAINDPVNRIDPLGQFSLIEQLQTFQVQAAIATIGAITIASGGAEWIIRKLSGGAVNFLPENITGETRPFFDFSVSVTGSNKRGGGVSSSIGTSINFGFEQVTLRDKAPVLYGYIGAGLGFTLSSERSKTSGESLLQKFKETGSIGANFRGAVGDVFDTPTYDDYKGMFVSLTGGFTFSVSFGAEIPMKFGLGGGLGAGLIRSIAWSPVPGSSGKFSHSRTDFKGGVGGSLAENSKEPSVSATLKAGMGVSFYFVILD